MSQSAGETLPYRSKNTFLTHGMEDVILHTGLDCSICREPLAVIPKSDDCARPHLPSQSVLSMSHTTVCCEGADDMEISSSGSTTTILPDDSLEAEQAVRIAPCNHTFGRTCLEAWFNTSESNCCPHCNRELFPKQHIKLFLHQPTRAMRLEFANYIEDICGDADTATQIRVNPMSGSVRLLIREFAMELWRRGGYLVEYEYTSDADADEEEEIEVEDEDEDESDELDIDGHVVDNRTSTEYGFAKKA